MVLDTDYMRMYVHKEPEPGTGYEYGLAGIGGDFRPTERFTMSTDDTVKVGVDVLVKIVRTKRGKCRCCGASRQAKHKDGCPVLELRGWLT